MVIKFTSPWQIDYSKVVPFESIDRICYFNDISVNEADYWIIWGDLQNVETVLVDKQNVIYIADECHENRFYNLDFLNQFNNIARVNPENPMIGTISIPEVGMWYFDKNYEEISNLQPQPKNKKLSVVCSDLTILPGHKSRYAFVNKLIGHFKDQIDVYGRGFNNIKDKWDALYDYEYSIAIENNVQNNYFTEKISECFLTYTVPFYYGCPNISEFFNPNSLINIDINDYKKSISIIEDSINSNTYYSKLEAIIESRNKYLRDYHFSSALNKIVETVRATNDSNQIYSKSTKVTLYPESTFQNTDKFKFVSMNSLIKEIFNRLLHKLV